ncbi:hypothetical protein MFRU_004g03870 [Monilinia fructicola]|nr:hypothetical protein MFRU_004g03870 [Monilinia fructicola]
MVTVKVTVAMAMVIKVTANPPDENLDRVWGVQIISCKSIGASSSSTAEKFITHETGRGEVDSGDLDAFSSPRKLKMRVSKVAFDWPR